MIAYAITDPSTLDFDTLEDDLKRFSSKASMIVYRDKQSSEYEKNAIKFLTYAKDFDKVLLHTDYRLAAKLHADGVHLRSTQLDNIAEAKALGLFVVVSTHTIQEAKKSQNLGADMITISPIFETVNKGKAIGLKVLKDVVSSVSIPVIALGGIITQEHIDSCEVCGAGGFASVRYYSTNIFKSP